MRHTPPSNAYSHNENLSKRKNLDMLEIGDASIQNTENIHIPMLLLTAVFLASLPHSKSWK
jgi:hypothetical protein